MRRKTIFTNFNDAPYFTKQELLVLADKFSISQTSLNTLIQRNVKDKTIISLKRNYYVTKEFFFTNRSNLNYKFYLANALCKPSYISRESALQYYGLLSEAVINYYTSISTKTTRIVKNALGIYEYRTIKAARFNDYKLVKFQINAKEYSYAIAEPHKAIYDYLYYRITKKNLSKDELILAMDDLRVNYHDLGKSDLNKLITLFL